MIPDQSGFNESSDKNQNLPNSGNEQSNDRSFSFNGQPDPNQLLQKVQFELLMRRAREQDAFRILSALVEEVKASPDETTPEIVDMLNEHSDALKAVKIDNFRYLLGLAAQGNFPLKRTLGEELSALAWKMIVEAPINTVDGRVVDSVTIDELGQLINALKPFAWRKDLELEQIFTLEDQLLLFNGLPQNFGSVWVRLNGGHFAVIVPSPMIEPAKVDERRKAEGGRLTLLEVGKSFAEQFKATPHFPAEYLEAYSK